MLRSLSVLRIEMNNYVSGGEKMRGKKMVAAAAMMALLMGTLSGCGKTSTEDDQLAQIKKNGKIVFAMEGTWAPWTYHDESGELVGFDTEVGKLIAAKLGVEAEFVEGEWDGLFAGLDVGRYDAVINGVEITDERAEKYDFTEPYAYIRTALVVGTDNDDIQSFEDLDGKTTANSFNSTYMLLAEDYGAECKNVDSLSETMDMVLSGRVDATLNAEVSIYDYLSEHPDAAIKIVALTDDASKVSIPLRKGDSSASLKTAIDQAIKELRESGELAAVSEKYFGSDITAE
jgi:cystine transport system substrate-binding protein